MAIKNNGALRILTKDKMSIISVDPKDISVNENFVYTYPRNQSFRNTEFASRIVLGEYEDEVYAKEVLQLIFTALKKEEGTFEMPDETALDEYEDQIGKRAFLGAEHIIKANTDYVTHSDEDAYGFPNVYTEGNMTVIDENTEVYLTIRNPGVKHKLDFTVSKNAKHIQKCYHTTHELLIDRYGAFLAEMHKESEKRNESAKQAYNDVAAHRGE